MNNKEDKLRQEYQDLVKSVKSNEETLTLLKTLLRLKHKEYIKCKYDE